MKACDKCDAIYCLMDVDEKLRDMDAATLCAYLDVGFAHYMSAEEAEAGRQNGDAYDEPGKTRVVGFRVVPFLPKRAKRKKVQDDA